LEDSDVEVVSETPFQRILTPVSPYSHNNFAIVSDPSKPNEFHDELGAITATTPHTNGTPSLVSSTSKKMSLDLRASADEKKSGLFKFFMPMPWEEYLKQAWVVPEWECELHECDEHQIHVEEHERLMHRRAEANRRKKKQRDHEQAAKSAASERTINSVLHAPAPPTLTHADVAEASRPYRELKRDKQAHEPEHHIGPQCKHCIGTATQINWQSPLLWGPIADAAQRIHQEKHYNSLCYKKILKTLRYICITTEAQIVIG